jgi:hypothetical protein
MCFIKVLSKENLSGVYIKNVIIMSNRHDKNTKHTEISLNR